MTTRGARVLVATAMAFSCAHAVSPPPVAAVPSLQRPALKIVSIVVEPSSCLLDGRRSSQQLLVTARLADGNVVDVTARAQFSSRRAEVATVEAGGTVRPSTALRPGTAADGVTEIAATVAGRVGKSVVTVRHATTVAPVSFIHEVIPVLTRSGCNQGICHGTPNGKAGFRLSLKGYAPEWDFDMLVRQAEGRRVNVIDPARSLLLLKPTAQVQHGGGRRFAVGSHEHGLLIRWIEQGARSDLGRAAELVKLEVLPAQRLLIKPALSQRLVTIAHFADGSRRDVTALTHFSSSEETLAIVSREGQVAGRKRGEVAILCRFLHEIASARFTLVAPQPQLRWAPPAEHNEIDRHLFAKLKLLQIPPSALCPDEEFLRRACLDSIGTIPTADEARAFLRGTGDFAGCTSRQKRTLLIEQLLQRSEFTDFWALKWADVLRVQERRLGENGARLYHRWIRDSIASGKALDVMVRELLTARGSYEANPPAAYYRVASEPESAAETTAQLFLGVRMGCARCHNHPYERWTQDEYYSLAAFFGQVRAGNTSVVLAGRGDVQQLRTGKIMRPKFLGGEYPEVEPGADRRVPLANWITDPGNPFFARSMVNRIWYHLFARGLVEPVDDFRESNPAANEPLLAALDRHFIDSKYDLRELVRMIMNSAAYQLSARPNALNKDDEVFFSHAAVRILTAEQLVDSVSLITGIAEANGLRAAQIPGTSADHPLLKAFNRPDRSLACECERDRDSNLGQALQVISGRAISSKISHDSGRPAALASSTRSDDAIVEELFLSALARFPRPPEREAALAALRSGPRRAAVEDLTWALINSKEALTRH